jgi:hypothetical protein
LSGATQPAKVTPFTGVTELLSEKAPQATFPNELEIQIFQAVLSGALLHAHARAFLGT